MFTAIYQRFASLTFGLWLMGGVMFCMAAGSFAQGEGSAINDLPLFAWLREVPFKESWWLWLTLAALGLLVLNTILCSIESLRQKWQRGSFIIRIAPQIMHLGFLLIVVAHLQSAIWSNKQTMPLQEGAKISFSDGHRLQLVNIQASYDKRGMPVAMSAGLRYPVGSSVQETTISPNHPLFYQGTGIYLKDVALEPSPAALIEIHEEPGAGLALVGALLFTFANLVLLGKHSTAQRGQG